MENKTIGENIAYYRNEKGLSQEKVAEYLGVSRQAVTKWESDQSRPSSDNLISLAELLDINVEELLGREIKSVVSKQSSRMSFKLPWLLFALSMITIVAYIVIGAITDRIDAGTCVLLFVMAIPIELFVHAYFTFCINNNTFTLIAGYDGTIEVNREEFKALLATIDFAFCAISTSCIVLIGVLNLSGLGPDWMNGAIVAVYTIDLIAAVLVAGQRSQSKIYVHEIDFLRARKGMKVTIGYLTALLLIVGGAVAGIMLNDIENNSSAALVIMMLMLLGIAIITVIYFIVDRRIRKWTP